MSTQFGGGEDQSAGSRATIDSEVEAERHAERLRGLVEGIALQLTQTEQHDSETLDHMLQRAKALGAAAHSYRSQVAPEYRPAFERIEDGVAVLADHIAERASQNEQAVDPAHAPQHGGAPLAGSELRPARTQATTSPEKDGIESFGDMAELTNPISSHPQMDNVDDGWEQRTADAFATAYEESLKAPDEAEDSPATAVAPSQKAPSGQAPRTSQSDTSQTPEADPGPAKQDTSDIGGLKEIFASNDHDWLDQRFLEIAQRLEKSLSSSQQEVMRADLGPRFDQLEQHFEKAVSGPDSQPNQSAMEQLEEKIAELALQFETTRGELSRLDNIEHSLAAVIDRLADPRFDSASAQSPASQPDLELFIAQAVDRISERLEGTKSNLPDFDGLADAVAERAASHFTNLGPANDSAGTGQVETVRQLLEKFMSERREGDEQTSALLDTMQRAVIRMLDRVDALEAVQKKGPGYSSLGDNFLSTTTESVASASIPVPAVTPPALPQSQAQSIADSLVAEKNAAATASAQPAAGNGAPPSIERLRQDFIANARRAKELAESSNDHGAGAASRSSRTSTSSAKQRRPIIEPTLAGSAPSQSKLTTEQSEASAPQATSSRWRRMPSRKVLVGAIVLMIALPGALLLLKKGGPASAPAKIESTTAPTNREIAPFAPAKQTIESSQPQQSEPLVHEPRNGASSEPPKPLLGEGEGKSESESAQQDTESQSTGAMSSPDGSQTINSNVAPENAPDTSRSKDYLFRSSPETTTKGLHQNIEVPADAPEGQDSNLPDRSDININRYPPAGIAVVTPRRAPSLDQLGRLNDRRALAQLSDQLGAAQVDAVPAALIPGFMTGDSTGAAGPDAVTVKSSLSDSHRQPLNLPPATVGPLSLRLAAAKGDPSAQFAVAVRFADGNGIKPDLAEAMRWYQRSASQGFAQSQYRVATFYERGLGTVQDNARAKVWYQRAAENGNVKAMHNLAVLSAGQTARTPDYKTAARWFQAAADHGLADSQFNLAILRDGGLGVTRDRTEAYKWFALAARSGDSEAARRQKDLEQSMASADLAAARELVNSWQPKRAGRIANDPLTASEDWKTRETAGGII
ncbi:MAG: tetratricopeptide repeat protein [Hyphomicrobiaceae bacterium]